MQVETNPTSNLVIGPMDNYGEHPIFQLTTDARGNIDKRIRVTVNTDNPGTKNTSLAHEYYIVGEEMLARGMPEPQVAEWLEWLRLNGEELSFLRHMPPADNDLMVQVLREGTSAGLWERGLGAKGAARQLWRWIVDMHHGTSRDDQCRRGWVALRSRER